MSKRFDPIVGNWYRHVDKGQMFQVVAHDDAGESIALQHFDGDLEEVTLPVWRMMDLEAAEPPEDWTGPIDIEHEEAGPAIDTLMTGDDWTAPLQETPRDRQEAWEDPRAAGDLDVQGGAASAEEAWHPENIEAVDSDSAS